MSEISRTYRLRRLSGSRDPYYPAALRVYVSNVGPHARTNSNEITYWLDRSYTEFGDDFIIFAFEVDQEVIGFCECAYFPKQRILFFDYLVLHKQHRSHGEYFQFVKLIQDWIDGERLEFDYAVAEVSFESATREPSEHSGLLVTLFKQMGFLVAQCEYWQPPLGLDNPQSDMRAHLLIASNEIVTSVRTETLIHIVKTIYYQHYARWFGATLASDEDRFRYCQTLDARVDALAKSISLCDQIVLDGVKMLERPLVSPRAPRAVRRPHWVSPLVVAGAIGVFCAGFLLLQHYVPTQATLVMILFGASLVVFVTSFSLFDKRALAVLNPILDFITKLFLAGQNNVTRHRSQKRDLGEDSVKQMKPRRKIGVARKEIDKA